MAIDLPGLNGCDSEPPFSAGRREAIRTVAVRARAASRVFAASAGATGNVTDLLARASDGDPVAWDEVMRRYDKIVSTTIRSFRLQDADALDAVQTTWLRLTENAHRVLWLEWLSGWLITAARHECVRIPRQAKLTPALIETVADTVADPSVGPEQQAITIGPTRARALRQLRDRRHEHGLGRRHGDETAAASPPCAARGPVARATTQTAANRVINSSSCINAAATGDLIVRVDVQVTKRLRSWQHVMAGRSPPGVPQA
jgi:DNA-directed RNA polymerase specialized sigma24 family protein